MRSDASRRIIEGNRMNAGIAFADLESGDHSGRPLRPLSWILHGSWDWGQTRKAIRIFFFPDCGSGVNESKNREGDLSSKRFTNAVLPCMMDSNAILNE